MSADQAPRNEKTFKTQHKGVRWRVKPLLDLEPMKFIMCFLHLLLAMCKSFWRRAILKYIDTRQKALAINTKLKEIGLNHAALATKF